MKSRLKFVLVYILITFLFSWVVAGFDAAAISPIHELGHATAAVLLGIRIIRIEWSEVQYVTTNDWRENVAGYSGGLFATVFLVLLYMIIKRTKLVLVRREMRAKLKRRLAGITIMLQTILLADIMMQLTSSVFEGSIHDVYTELGANIPALFTIIMISTGISVFICLVRMDESTTELLSVKRQTSSTIENQTSSNFSVQITTSSPITT